MTYEEVLQMIKVKYQSDGRREQVLTKVKKFNLKNI